MMSDLCSHSDVGYRWNASAGLWLFVLRSGLFKHLLALTKRHDTPTDWRKIEASKNEFNHTFRNTGSIIGKILIRDRTKVKSDFHSPPVEAVLQLSTRVESAALQWYHTFSLEFRESLSTVLQLRGHGAQGVIHPGCHLHNTHRTQLNANNSVNRFVSCWNYKWATTHIRFPGPGTVHLIKKYIYIFFVVSYFCYKHWHRP